MERWISRRLPPLWSRISLSIRSLSFAKYQRHRRRYHHHRNRHRHRHRHHRHHNHHRNHDRNRHRNHRHRHHHRHRYHHRNHHRNSHHHRHHRRLHLRFLHLESNNKSKENFYELLPTNDRRSFDSLFRKNKLFFHLFKLFPLKT